MEPEKQQRLLIVAMGNTIRILRKRRGFAQERLANEAGIDRAHMSSIERGKHAATIYTLSKLLPILQIGYTEFGVVLDIEIAALANSKKAKRPNGRPPLLVLLVLLKEAVVEFNSCAARFVKRAAQVKADLETLCAARMLPT